MSITKMIRNEVLSAAVLFSAALYVAPAIAADTTATETANAATAVPKTEDAGKTTEAKSQDENQKSAAVSEEESPNIDNTYYSGDEYSGFDNCPRSQQDTADKIM